MLRVDARSKTQGESLPCLWLQMLYLKKGKKLDKFEARSVDGIFFGYASHLEHIVCSILKLTKS
jgi:hypothetical protein